MGRRDRRAPCTGCAHGGAVVRVEFSPDGAPPGDRQPRRDRGAVGREPAGASSTLAHSAGACRRSPSHPTAPGWPPSRPTRRSRLWDAAERRAAGHCCAPASRTPTPPSGSLVRLLARRRVAWRRAIGPARSGCGTCAAAGASRSLAGPGAAGPAVGFAPDGRRVAVAGGDGGARSGICAGAPPPDRARTTGARSTPRTSAATGRASPPPRAIEPPPCGTRPHGAWLVTLRGHAAGVDAGSPGARTAAGRDRLGGRHRPAVGCRDREAAGALPRSRAAPCATWCSTRTGGRSRARARTAARSSGRPSRACGVTRLPAHEWPVYRGFSPERRPRRHRQRRRHGKAVGRRDRHRAPVLPATGGRSTPRASARRALARHRRAAIAVTASGTRAAEAPASSS